MNNIKLYITIPCYNEEEVLPETSKRIGGLLTEMIDCGEISPESKILFIDDGSKDNTWKIIQDLSRQQIFEGIKLSRNSGHQGALMAGLMTAKNSCDCVISIDADLQDDLKAIPLMIEKFKQGCDIVYGVRKERKTDSWFKRNTAHFFYKLMKVLGADVLENHADYRLMSRRALEALSEFKEVNLFLRGIVRLVGYKSDIVYYDRTERFAGESKYPLKKMLSFAFDGITSFSIKPIRLVWALGTFVCFLAVIAAIYTFCSWLMGNSVTGWSSLMISIWFLGGVQLISVGVIGEYIGKIYKETKSRPIYIIEDNTLGFDKKN